MRRFINIVLVLSLILLSAFPVSASDTKSIYFSDMGNYSWAVEAVDEMYEYGFICGKVAPTDYSYGIFDPSSEVTVAELSEILCNMSKERISFEGKVTYWYDEAIAFVTEFGIVDNDYTTCKSYPFNYVSREECFFAIYNFIHREFGETIGPSDHYMNYKDNRYMSSRYVSTTTFLIDLGYIVGSNGSINPRKTLNRAELAVIIYRIVKAHSDCYEKVNTRPAYIEKMREYPEATTVWITLKSFGWNDYVCAGILGNMMAEVGGHTLDLNCCNCVYDHMPYGYYTGSFGLCAWTPSSNYYNSQYYVGISVEDQCRFIRDSLAEQISWCLSVEEFLSIDNIWDASYYFMRAYERPASYNTTARYNDSLIAYNYFVNNN